jgi:hypothetical protein
MKRSTREAIETIINPDGKGETIVEHKPISSEHFQIVPHGHVVPRADGILARCGGPGLCAHCREEQKRLDRGTYPHISGIHARTRADDERLGFL